jgi:lipoate-protein ligase A
MTFDVRSQSPRFLQAGDSTLVVMMRAGPPDPITLYWPQITGTAERQMAVDAVLAQWCAAGRFDALVRFYRMTPPGVTIGRHQRYQSVIDEEFLARRGWGWSRRITGGGALLHRNELNYAVILSRGSMRQPSEFGFQSTFQIIMAGIEAGLKLLGCRPMIYTGSMEVKDRTSMSAHGLCERAITRHEISVDGRKAAAAAQLMLPDACLQHGTIYLKSPQPEDSFWPQRSLTAADGSHWWDTSDFLSCDDDAVSHLENLLSSSLADSLELNLTQSSLPGDFETCVEDQIDKWAEEEFHRHR